MLVPIAAVFLAVGVVSTPAMLEAEREYLKQEPAIEVQDIQASVVQRPVGGELGW